MYSFNDSDFEVCENIIAMYIGNMEEKNIVIDTKNIDWDAIQYLIGEVSYGGRITDDNDLKLMKVYTREYFNGAVIEETKFMLSGGNVPYMIPDDTNVKLPPDITNPAHFYREYIKNPLNFPTVERPEAFGQHVNAEIASQRNDTRELLNSILVLQPRVVNLGGESREDKVYSLAMDLVEKIPESMNLEEVKEKWKRDESPLKTVL
jgi:dynein heavy chain